MNSVSGGASHKRAISAARVDLPLPVGPTMASVEPAGTCRLISCSTPGPRCGVCAGRIGEIQMAKFDFAANRIVDSARIVFGVRASTLAVSIACRSGSFVSAQERRFECGLAVRSS